MGMNSMSARLSCWTMHYIFDAELWQRLFHARQIAFCQHSVHAVYHEALHDREKPRVIKRVFDTKGGA